MSEENARDKFMGALWAEVRQKIRDSELAVADKVRVLDFLGEKTTEMAGQTRDSDLDAKLHEAAVQASSDTGKAVASIKALASLCATTPYSSLVSGTLATKVRDADKTAATLFTVLRDLAVQFRARVPDIVERVSALSPVPNIVERGRISITSPGEVR